VAAEAEESARSRRLASEPGQEPMHTVAHTWDRMPQDFGTPVGEYKAGPSVAKQRGRYAALAAASSLMHAPIQTGGFKKNFIGRFMLALWGAARWGARWRSNYCRQHRLAPPPPPPPNQEGWTQSVKTAVQHISNARVPISLWLGPELRLGLQLYLHSLPFETKHPAILRGTWTGGVV